MVQRVERVVLDRAATTTLLVAMGLGVQPQLVARVAALLALMGAAAMV
jgi:hypothetical protein